MGKDNTPIPIAFSFAFVPTTSATSIVGTNNSRKRNGNRNACGCKVTSRRNFLKQGVLGATALILGLMQSPDRSDAADDKSQSGSESTCQNCHGTGKVPCELCLGTGFWRAISGNDPRQKYKGVVCPECEGTGNLICPVCLGTGEGNVRGLLRRRTVQPGPGRILQS